MERLRAYIRVLRVAKKHVVNWFWLLLLAALRRRGVFLSRRGGRIKCDAQALLRTLVRLEDSWSNWGEVLPLVGFDEGRIVVGSYFGHDLRVPLNAIGVLPPTFFLKKYPIDLEGDVVLDIGAYIGDTPLLWLYKGAERVIAIEPVPEHYDCLVANVVGLPVITIKASIAVRLPDAPKHYGKTRYGLLEIGTTEYSKLLDMPVASLVELVKSYNVTAVKLNCEGCEHFVIEELAHLPSLGVKKIMIDFHDIKGHEARLAYEWLRKRLGDGKITLEKITKIRIFSVLWEISSPPP